MTTGHKHRHLRVRSWDTPLVRVLRRPLWHRSDTNRVDASPYPYGVCPQTDQGAPTCYTLSLLGILHRWTGLTLEVREP